MENMTTGSDLKKWRIANHLTQKQLAEKMSYSTSRISHIEYGDEHLPKRLIRELENLDILMHPIKKKDPISEKWESINYYSNIYGDEMSVIKDAIINLLTIDIDKNGFDKTEAYLKFIGSALLNLSNVKNVSFSDDRNKNTLKLFNNMYREALIYLKKISA